MGMMLTGVSCDDAGAAFKDVTKTGLRVGLGAATLGATEHTGLGKSSGEVVDSAFNNVEQQINRVRGTGKPLPKSQSKPKSQYATGGYPQEQDSGVNEQGELLPNSLALSCVSNSHPPIRNHLLWSFFGSLC